MLSVAAAATATTLLSPESLSTQPSRSTAQSAMQTIIERLRPQRNRANQSVEAALGDYLRTVLRDNRRFAEAVAGDTPNGANVPAEFQDFLHTLQEDLIQAVRAYAVPDAGGDEGEEAPAATTGEAMVVNDEGAASAPASDSVTAAPPDASTAMAAESASPSIPTFHRQRGQNLPGVARPLGVSGGSDGTPRRLNFFRAHLFPTVHADGSVVTPTPSEGQEEAIVPSIFVGVRSIAHSPNMTTEDLVSHPSFPFMDGQVPEEATAGAATSSSPSASPLATTHVPLEDEHNFDRDLEQELAASPSTSQTVDNQSPRRSLRSRVLERFGATRREPRASPPLNTYLIYVIGGNYPRSHPVLSIPSLVSGGPLTAEDLQLLSELLGPAKPPTVTAEELVASGLKIVQANTLAQAVQDGEVLDSSTERCMVSWLVCPPTDARCASVTTRMTMSAASSSAVMHSTLCVWTSGSRRVETRARRAAPRRSTRVPFPRRPRSKTPRPSRRCPPSFPHPSQFSYLSAVHVCTSCPLARTAKHPYTGQAGPSHPCSFRGRSRHACYTFPLVIRGLVLVLGSVDAVVVVVNDVEPGVSLREPGAK